MGKERSQKYVDYIIRRCKEDKGVAASLRRADNPATEYQSWEVLAGFGVDLENDYQRLSHATISAAIARAGVDADGNVGIGRALASCYPEEKGKPNNPAKVKLRRLLACEDCDEACRILRPLLRLIDSKKSNYQINYAELLDQLLWFNPNKIPQRWAQDFYRSSGSNEETKTAAS